jgi:hypothetical protein
MNNQLTEQTEEHNASTKIVQITEQTDKRSNRRTKIVQMKKLATGPTNDQLCFFTLVPDKWAIDRNVLVETDIELKITPRMNVTFENIHSALRQKQLHL